MTQKNDPVFTSLGMFIIDENQYPESSQKEPIQNIIGGGGTYAIIGSRIIAGAKNSKQVCGIIDKGYDFPIEVEEEILSWDSGIIWKEDLSRMTTRGINIYNEEGIRNFKYKCMKKRIEAEDIISDPYLLNSRSFHIISSIERCESIISKILENVPAERNPIFIYEPLPDACVSSNYESLIQILPKIDVFTPNLNEASDLADLPKLPENTTELELLASKFSPYLTKPSSGTVIRCGSMGCFIKSDEVEILLPAYHIDQNTVIDVTGGGNLFCGAFATGLLLSKGDWIIAGISGNIVSGCIIEKLGMPKLESQNDSTELWNGLSTQDRLKKYFNQNQDILKNRVDLTQIYWL